MENSLANYKRFIYNMGILKVKQCKNNQYISFKRLGLPQKEMDLVVFLEQLTLRILPLALDAPIKVKKIYCVSRPLQENIKTCNTIII